MLAVLHERDEALIYVARAACGCIRGMVVDDPKHRASDARMIAGWRADGLTVRLVPESETRKPQPPCPRGLHGIKAEPLPLFAEPVTLPLPGFGL